MSNQHTQQLSIRVNDREGVFEQANELPYPAKTLTAAGVARDVLRAAATGSSDLAAGGSDPFLRACMRPVRPALYTAGHQEEVKRRE